MTTGITYQDGMGRTVRQVSDSQVTDYSYDLSGQTLTEYTETDEQAGRLIVHVIDENGQETATLKNPVWDSASAAYTIGEDTCGKPNQSDGR